MTAQLTLDWTLDPMEAKTLHALSSHRGRAAAIGCEALAREVGTTPRMLQHAVHRLRIEHGAPIASTAAKPYGYFLVQSPAEIEGFVREQRAKALGTLAAIAAVKRVNLAELLGQLAIEVGR